MSPYTVIATIAAYLALLFAVAWVSGRKADNATFFTGNRRSPWWAVAVGMIAAPMSGVTFVSVPGMVATSGWAYLQMAMGFVCGYMVIAFVLMPMLYRRRIVSVYEYLAGRFGAASHRTGAMFFFVSKLLGAALKIYLVCLVLGQLVFEPLGVPFVVNAGVMMLLVWLYTRRGGVRAIVWTDGLKTVCLVTSVGMCMWFIARELGLDFGGMVEAVRESEMSRVWFFDDVDDRRYFFKQFLSGLFIVVAMTGLDQDMMQLPLSCRSPRDSQKNFVASGLAQFVVIAGFLSLGVLLNLFVEAQGLVSGGASISGAVADATSEVVSGAVGFVADTASGEASVSGMMADAASGAASGGFAVGSGFAAGDGLFPFVATGAGLPAVVGVVFVLGLIASTYSAAGSALTALTTSFTVDVLGAGGFRSLSIKTDRKRASERQNPETERRPSPNAGESGEAGEASCEGANIIKGIYFYQGLNCSEMTSETDGGFKSAEERDSFKINEVNLAESRSEEARLARTRRWVHGGMAATMVLVIMAFLALAHTSVIDAVYVLASYTYGPVLGMFAFGMATRRQVRDRWVPLVALLSPALCLVLDLNSEAWFGGYRFGYELLIMNAAFTAIGLTIIIRKTSPGMFQDDAKGLKHT